MRTFSRSTEFIIHIGKPERALASRCFRTGRFPVQSGIPRYLPLFRSSADLSTYFQRTYEVCRQKCTQFPLKSEYRAALRLYRRPALVFDKYFPFYGEMHTFFKATYKPARSRRDTLYRRLYEIPRRSRDDITLSLRHDECMIRTHLWK